jgi:hypothetical protein
VGFAVRRDWPDDTHEFVGLRETLEEAERFLSGDREYWRRGPLWPRDYPVVWISRHDFDLHANRRDCRSPECPTATSAPGGSGRVSR